MFRGLRAPLFYRFGIWEVNRVRIQAIHKRKMKLSISQEIDVKSVEMLQGTDPDFAEGLRICIQQKECYLGSIIFRT